MAKMWSSQCPSLNSQQNRFRSFPGKPHPLDISPTSLLFLIFNNKNSTPLCSSVCSHAVGLKAVSSKPMLSSVAAITHWCNAVEEWRLKGGGGNGYAVRICWSIFCVFICLSPQYFTQGRLGLFNPQMDRRECTMALNGKSWAAMTSLQSRGFQYVDSDPPQQESHIRYPA